MPNPERISQADRLLQLLENELSRKLWNPEAWITLPQIMSLHIASHTRRIHELRKAGHNIEMKDEYVEGQRRTAYRLVR